MGYDVLFEQDQFLISLMLFGYAADVPYHGKGDFKLDEKGTLAFIDGYVWPQELWIEILALAKSGLDTQNANGIN